MHTEHDAIVQLSFHVSMPHISLTTVLSFGGNYLCKVS